MKKRHSIATRIFAIFALVGGIASTAVLTNFYSFRQVADSVETTIHGQLPTLISAAKIAHTGGMIITESSKLASSDSVASLIQAERNLEASLPVLIQLADVGLVSQRQVELLALVNALELNITKIFVNSQEKLRLRAIQNQISQQLHWLQVDFVDEVEPLATESQYNLSQLVAALKQTQRLSDPEMERLNSEVYVQAQLLKFEADVNLVLDLLQRIPLLPSRNDVLSAQSMVDENLHTIDQQIEVLRAIPSTITLRQMAEGLKRHIDGSNSVVERSLRVLVLNEQNETLLEENRDLILRIKVIIDQAIEDAERVNTAMTQDLTETINQSKQQLNMALSAILAMTLVMAWFLKKHILNRLAYVLKSMRHLAEGKPQQMIHVPGKDEVALLADATNVFYHQSQQLRDYTQSLEQTNEQLVVEVQQRKRTEEELKETQEELIQAGKLAVLGQLTTGIVHEFSQPLAAIRSNTYLAEQYLMTGENEKAKLKIDKINAVTDRATKLCQHLKSFARKSDDYCQSICLTSAIYNALDLFSETLPREFINIDVPTNMRVMANDIRLEQVFVNLISNSIDALEKIDDGRSPFIKVCAIEQGKYAYVVLSDNGCGMSDAQIKRVFEPFFTTKEVGKGLGLGMSITHNIIHDFGGSIQLTSTLNQGTEVTLCLKTTY
tara:strand:+ start:3526 stop:5523 length:1998 start_codon:yes stop_codon:yes gene_type:complete